MKTWVSEDAKPLASETKFYGSNLLDENTTAVLLWPGPGFFFLGVNAESMLVCQACDYQRKIQKRIHVQYC